MENYWIFDFDGTLVDSEIAIKKCYKNVTRKIAPNRVHIAQSIMVGPSLEESSSEILGQNLLHLVPDFKNLFQKEYDEKILFETLMYPNTETILKILDERGDKMAIATNKRAQPTLSLIKHFKWDGYFEFISCIDQFSEAKNKSEMVKSTIEKNPCFKNSYFVGDTLSDGRAAKENNLLFIRADYGYGLQDNWSGLPIHKSISSIDELVCI